MENSVNIMRAALIISIIGHVLFMLFTDRDLRPTAHGEVMTVDLVRSDEVPGAKDPKGDDAATQAKAEKPEAKPEPQADKPAQPQTAKASPKPEPQAQETKAQETKIVPPQPDPLAQMTKWAEQKSTPPTQQQPVQPQPAQTAAMPDAKPTSLRETAPNMNRLAATLGLPMGEAVTSGTSAAPMTKLTEGVSEFKAQVRKCFKLPASISPTQPFAMIIRVAFKPNGALDGEPELIGGRDAPHALELRDNALRAIRQCAPYRMPSDKYEQWKVLDIDFSPDKMMGS